MTVPTGCIREVFSPENHEYRTNAGRLIGAVAPRANLTLVTTNYDLNIEIGAATLGARVECTPQIHEGCVSRDDPAGRGTASIYATPFVTDSAATSWTVRLCKLHGSVKWYDGGERLVVEDRWRYRIRYKGKASPI